VSGHGASHGTRLLSLFVAGMLGCGASAAAASAHVQSLQLGRSQGARPIVAFRVGDPHGTRVLVVGCIHGTECAGMAVARALVRVYTGLDLWIVPNLNPDGYARGVRQNGRGVDLNANWSSQWHGGGRPWDTYYPGPHPFSERETRIARNVILRIRPRVTIWFHQHMNLVWAWGQSSAAGRIYARAARMRFYHRHWLHGTATNWQNHHLPGSASFTVELRAGALTRRQIRRQVDAVLTLGAAMRGPAHAFASAGGSAEAAPRTRPARAAWTRRVDQLIGHLALSVSVAAHRQLLYAHAGTVARPPASDEKLLLSMVLLDRFGPRYRIRTRVEGRRPLNGTLRGSLWLVGGGDPELSDAALDRLARKLRATGIRTMYGSVVGVTNTFTRERWAPGWRPIALQFVALPTALTYDGNSNTSGFVLDPERRAAAALTAHLRALGVRVTGRPRAGRAPPAARRTLATIESAPLLEILRRQNRDSLNFDAEVLTKMLGAATYGPPGSIAKGARAIEGWARGHGVKLVAHDGSGLSYTNRVSTNGIVRLLTVSSRRQWGRPLRSTLPAAGEGTLARRLLTLRVRAKTGTLLNHVSALSGWIWVQRQRRWAEFAILSRGLSKPQAVALEDAIIGTIANDA
jgi:protein MpaA